MQNTDAHYYAQLYTAPELRQLRATATTELAARTSSTASIAEGEDRELTHLLDRIGLYTAALLVLVSQPQLV